MTDLDRYDSDDQTVLGRFRRRDDHANQLLDGLEYTPADLHNSCARIRAAARYHNTKYLSLYGKEPLPTNKNTPAIQLPTDIFHT